jgi:tRNA-dihydrouridine synthase B
MSLASTITEPASELRQLAYKPLQIANIPIGLPVVQAALSGYSDWAMRVLARRMGAPYTLCEVLLDQFINEHSHFKKNAARVRVTPDEYPVGGQLMGANPEDFGPAALRLVELGFTIIDINFGCPVRKVMGRCRGGFHLSQPTVALEIVTRVREALPPDVPVTLKMRRGIDDTNESRDKFYTILDGAFARGAAAITVHGRTVKQGYIGPSRWEFLREVKQYVGERTILGSGDLFTPEACVAMIRETGVDGVTAARGAIGNPWIFEQCRELLEGRPLPEPPSLFEQRRVIGEHYALADDLHGEVTSCRMMRKFGIKFARLHPQGLVVRDAFIAARTRAEIQEVFDRYYSEDLPGRHPTSDEVDEVQECG